MIQGRFLLLLCIVAVTVGAATAQTCKANVAAATNFNASQVNVNQNLAEI